jgi:hypothetical protein
VFFNVWGTNETPEILEGRFLVFRNCQMSLIEGKSLKSSSNLKSIIENYWFYFSKAKNKTFSVSDLPEETISSSTSCVKLKSSGRNTTP